MATMQAAAFLCSFTCILLLSTPQVSIGATGQDCVNDVCLTDSLQVSLLQSSLSQSSRLKGSSLQQEKPFLDGDFTRDSSNPLDAYEDSPMSADSTNATAPAAEAAPAPAASEAAPAPEAATGADANAAEGAADANAAKGTGKGGGKGKGKGKGKDGEASAVQLPPQVALAGASVGASVSRSIGNQLQDPAPTTAPAATEAQPAAKVAPAAATPSNATAVATPSNATTNQATAESTGGVSVAGCVTRKDERAVAWWSQTSPEGTQCVFGVDVEDEGTHCMFGNGEYGTNGWCWTAKDRSGWGSCNDGCPLYGPTAVIGTKIDGVSQVLSKISDKVNQLADSKTSNGAGMSNAPKAEKSSNNDDAKKDAKKDAKEAKKEKTH